MPRYYFAQDGNAPETEGEELPDDAAALDVARIVAWELSQKNQPTIVTAHRENGEVVPSPGGLIVSFELPRPKLH